MRFEYSMSHSNLFMLKLCVQLGHSKFFYIERPPKSQKLIFLSKKKNTNQRNKHTFIFSTLINAYHYLSILFVL